MSVSMIPDVATPPTTKRESRGDHFRICHVSMTLLTGGLERLLVEFGRHHDAQRFDLRFVSLAELGPPADELRQMGFSVESVDLPQRGKLAALRSLRNILQRDRVDIVHTHNTYAHFYGTVAASWAGVPYVINSQHGRGCGPRAKDKLLFRLANLKAARVVGVSEDAAALCRGEDPWAAGKTQVIWNGIDTSRFVYRGPAAAPVAISVARLSPEKDFPTLLQAVSLVVRDVPDFKLMMIGNGAERAKLEALAGSLGITSNVDFLGERKDVPELLAQAGFFVSSSKSEGISLTILEAMAVGLPVVTTRVGGNPEIVLEGETGYLVPDQNPEALAAAMLKMLSQREVWPAMGERGRQRVEQQFEIRTMIRQYEELYTEVLGAKQS
ncbi:MAG: GT4 family glycosyltransferase PelF [Planctomycetaceae bacterium]